MKELRTTLKQAEIKAAEALHAYELAKQKREGAVKRLEEITGAIVEAKAAAQEEINAFIAGTSDENKVAAAEVSRLEALATTIKEVLARVNDEIYEAREVSELAKMAALHADAAIWGKIAGAELDKIRGGITKAFAAHLRSAERYPEGYAVADINGLLGPLLWTIRQESCAGTLPPIIEALAKEYRV